MTIAYPCPCCGYLVFGDLPGSYGICPICFWEDDLSQLRFPMTGGANHVTLVDGQRNFIGAPRFGGSNSLGSEGQSKGKESHPR